MTRRVRLGGGFAGPRSRPRAARWPCPPSRDRGRAWRPARRGLLIALALAQFAIAAPMLFLGHDREAGLHAAHELGSFNLALAIAFAVGAIRPRLSAGLAWPCAIAAGGLVATAIIDLIGGPGDRPGRLQGRASTAREAIVCPRMNGFSDGTTKANDSDDVWLGFTHDLGDNYVFSDGHISSEFRRAVLFKELGFWERVNVNGVWLSPDSPDTSAVVEHIELSIARLSSQQNRQQRT